MRTSVITASAMLVLVACSGKDDPKAGDPCEVSGNICTWLGQPDIAGVSADDLDRLDTWLFMPVDIDFGPDGSAYYPDFNNHRVRMVSPDGVVSTISGTTMLGDGPNSQGSVTNCWGPTGCDALDSAWNHPTNVAVNPSAPNEVWVAAWHNSRINVIDTATTTMTWYAGTGGRMYGATDVDGDGTVLDDAIMDLPSSVAFADNGDVYFSDQANHLIRRITAAGELEDVAGTPRHAGVGGDGGPASDALIHGHTDQKADPGSKLVISDNILYLADTVNNQIRTIDLDSGIIDVVAGAFVSKGTGMITDGATGLQYEGDLGGVPGYAGDGGDALAATLNQPRDVAVCGGEVYIADTNNRCVRAVGTDGTIRTFAGTCGEIGFAGDEGPATEALMGNDDIGIFGVGVDAECNVYVMDSAHHVIRRVKK